MTMLRPIDRDNFTKICMLAVMTSGIRILKPRNFHQGR